MLNKATCSSYRYRYKKPSFGEGIARLFDFGNALGKPKFSHTDCYAIQSDWETIGSDLYQAMLQFEEQKKL